MFQEVDMPMVIWPVVCLVYAGEKLSFAEAPGSASEWSRSSVAGDTWANHLMAVFSLPDCYSTQVTLPLLFVENTT